MSGLWLARVVLRVCNGGFCLFLLIALKDQGASTYTIQEFTIFIQQQDEKKFTGSTVNGATISGTLAENSISFEMKVQY